MKKVLTSVEAAYANITITENEAAATAAEDGTVVISGGPSVQYDDAALEEIAASVAKIRNLYAQ